MRFSAGDIAVRKAEPARARATMYYVFVEKSHTDATLTSRAVSLVASLRGASRLKRRRWAAGEPYDDDDDDDYSGGLMARSLCATVIGG